MSLFPAFLILWVATILAAFFWQGRWGEKLSREGLISPIPVACLWPFGLFAAAAAAPFALAYFLGVWTKGWTNDRQGN